MGRDKFPVQSLGTLYTRIKTARVLLIGAGGIGCELLKNLSLTGFGDIHVVDLDTIDLSNLNRQFLFRHEHIKKSKALVAKSSAAKFNPNIKITAHHADIKDAQFDVNWVKTFAIVFNALDNLEARRHVNKMCLAANTPLIESGTTGFNGQVQPIKKSITECYDCTVKETPKTFPVCTIRSTPSQPIHCIVWAKSYLFAELFGVSEDDIAEPVEAAEGEDIAEIASLRDEARALKILRESSNREDFSEVVFRKVFEKDILRLCSMKDMWKTRKAPTPLDYTQLATTISKANEEVASEGHREWTLNENFHVFNDSLKRLSRRWANLHENVAERSKGQMPAILFDKDDVDIMDFVTASSNLRSIVFGIESKSKFDVKQMAGNIIPAIATTNAMVAGLCVLQAFKVLRENYEKAKITYLTKSTDRIVSSESLRPPRQDCPVCGVTYASVLVDMSRATIDDFVNILRIDLQYSEFSVSVDTDLLFDPDFEDNLKMKLSQLGVTNKSFLTVKDEGDGDPRTDLVFTIIEKSFPVECRSISVIEPLEIRKAFEIRHVPEADKETKTQINGITGKRKRDPLNTSSGDELKHKQDKIAKLTVPTGQITLDDSIDGSIVLED